MFSDDLKKQSAVKRKHARMKTERTGDMNDSFNDYDAGESGDYCYIRVHSRPYETFQTSSSESGRL